LSAVGAAFSVGACVAGVCAQTPELKANTPATATIAIRDPAAFDIAVPFLFECLGGFRAFPIAMQVAPANR